MAWQYGSPRQNRTGKTLSRTLSRTRTRTRKKGAGNTPSSAGPLCLAGIITSPLTDQRRRRVFSITITRASTSRSRSRKGNHATAARSVPCHMSQGTVVRSPPGRLVAGNVVLAWDTSRNRNHERNSGQSESLINRPSPVSRMRWPSSSSRPQSTNRPRGSATSWSTENPVAVEN